MNLNVLYEDNHLIAVFKPAGILTQPDKTGDISLMDEVKKYRKEKREKALPAGRQAGNVFLGLLHRLDRPVSGIVLFAKTSKGASRISEQFREGSIEKIYKAVVPGIMPQKKGMLVNYLQKDEENKKALPGKGKKAVLHYQVIKSNGRYSLLEIRPETGKFHQIRAQLSLAGFPILGDAKYGSKESLPDKSIALSAVSIFFKLPTEDEIKKISINMPLQWNEYIN